MGCSECHWTALCHSKVLPTLQLSPLLYGFIHGDGNTCSSNSIWIEIFIFFFSEKFCLIIKRFDHWYLFLSLSVEEPRGGHCRSAHAPQFPKNVCKLWKEKKKTKSPKHWQLITPFAGLYRLTFYYSVTKTLDAHWNQTKLAAGLRQGAEIWEIQIVLLSLTLGPTTEYCPPCLRTRRHCAVGYKSNIMVNTGMQLSKAPIDDGCLLEGVQVADTEHVSALWHLWFNQWQQHRSSCKSGGAQHPPQEPVPFPKYSTHSPLLVPPDTVCSTRF